MSLYCLFAFIHFLVSPFFSLSLSLAFLMRALFSRALFTNSKHSSGACFVTNAFYLDFIQQRVFLCAGAAIANEKEKHENQMMETYFPCMDKIKSAY